MSEITIKDKSTGGYETPLSDVLDNLQGDSPDDWGLDPRNVLWSFVFDNDDESDQGHWEWKK